MGVLIRNGTIVTALDRWVGDVLCRDGKIVALGSGLEKGSNDEAIDAAGQYVFPGGIDPHVHMELPFMGSVSADDFESGSAAGVAGGTTTIIDFVIPGPEDDAMAALAAWHDKARKAVADYAFHMCITSWGEQAVDWMTRCVREQGIFSFKLFMAYRGAVGIDDAQIIEALRTAADLGALIMVHAEHGEMVEALQAQLIAEGHVEPRYHALSRPPEVEGEATGRVIMMAGLIGAPVYIVHMTCREAVAAVAAARQRGQRVYGETCAQYLLLDDSVYDKPDFEGASYVMSPPIRPPGHQESLWSALGAGILQTVGSDHCPFNLVGQKDLGRDDFRQIPNGAAGVEHRLALLYTYGVLAGRIDLHQFVNLTSAQPAKIFGLYPRKGAIAVGADADLVVWDPEASGTISARTHHHRVDRSIYEGFATRGAPAAVVVNGRVQARDGDLKVERGAGRFLPRSTS